MAVRGGAERLTLELANALAGTDLCYGFRQYTAIPKERTRKLNCYDLNAYHEQFVFKLLKLLFAFSRKTQFINDYQWVLYSGIYSPISVCNRRQASNIYYCHTIPRFAFDLKDHYLNRLPLWLHPVYLLFGRYMAFKYKKALAQMDIIIANSDNVARQLKHHFGANAQTIHPPVDIESFKWQSQRAYYLSTARLESYKRIDLIIDAFKGLPNKKLIVASGGSEFARLKERAKGHANIQFTGWLDDESLQDLVGNAIATICIPINEDFGMSPVESMAAGKPVIGVAEGGLLETIINRKTGFLIGANPCIEELRQAICAMTPQRALKMRSACEQHALRFDKASFINQMSCILGKHS